MINLKAACLAAKQRERQRALAQALREMAQQVVPKLPDWEVEREAQAQRRGGPVRAGWHTVNEPEQRRYIVYGTVDDQRVTGPHVVLYDDGPGLGDVGDGVIDTVRHLTGESYNDVFMYGPRPWFGPPG